MDLAGLEARIAVATVLDLPALGLTANVEPTGLIFGKPAALPVAWNVT